jgi:hypothetical protein
MRSLIRPYGEPAAVKSTRVGARVLLDRDNVLEVVGIDPADEPPDRPRTITIAQAVELTNLSRRTIADMVARGRAKASEASQENAA